MKFLRLLLNSDSYDHSVTNIELLETHISWVILTGEYAYKIKKPVNLGFLDFSSLEKRRFYCNEEIRLNKRLAPQIYLTTVSLNGNENSLKINGSGPVLDYAVKMRQFRQLDQFDRLLENNLLNRRDMENLADLIAEFHQTIPSAAPETDFGDPDHIYTPVVENFTRIVSPNQEDKKALTEVSHWSQQQFNRLRPLFTERKKNGFVRECHGDMHLRNIAKYQNHILIFDCIEFNANLRWIDVISEIAFIEMDLHDRGRLDYANVLLNRYLQITGDYPAMRLLRFYLVYRAMVRAKVDWIRAHQDDIDGKEQTAILQEFRHYLNLARQFTLPHKPVLIITCGLSGCGKTYVSDQLMEHLPFIRLRSDVERKRLFGIAADEKSHSTLDTGIYSRKASIKTYDRLAQLSHLILTSQWSVLVDAAFLHADQRQAFQELADNLGIPFLILHFTAPQQVLMDRVRQRQQSQKDASEADTRVLESQISRQEPLSAKETPYAIEIDSSADLDIPNLAQRIQRRLQG